jgi:hypothetical protein
VVANGPAHLQAVLHFLVQQLAASHKAWKLTGNALDAFAIQIMTSCERGKHLLVAVFDNNKLYALAVFRHKSEARIEPDSADHGGLSRGLKARLAEERALLSAFEPGDDHFGA